MAIDNVMVDLETLGTTADSAIISIGAVKFDIESGKMDESSFYTRVSIQSNLDWKRMISASTLKWWLTDDKVSQEARNGSFAAGGELELGEMLEQFATWLAGPVKWKIWANGSDFDTPMLAHAFKEAGMKTPWEYFNSRCVRTYKNLPQGRDVKVERVGTHHNALDDAIYQTNLVCAIHRKLMGKK